jgi:hypothetical protein
MSDSRNLKESFNKKSLSTFLKDFTAPKARQRAMDTLGQSERATSAALGHFKKVADKNKPVGGLDYTPQGKTRGGQEKQARVYSAHKKLKTRLDKIERAADNRLERIKKSQGLETRVQQKTGRSMSQEFRRTR